MRKTFIVSLLVAMLSVEGTVLATSASAQTVPESWIQGSEVAAQHYWDNTTPQTCDGTLPTIAQLPLPVDGGDAVIGACLIQMNSSATWFTPRDFCMAFTHEWGHLTLGATYFAATNPADPKHSLDPTSIMQAGSQIYSLPDPYCDTFAATVTSRAPLVVQYSGGYGNWVPAGGCDGQRVRWIKLRSRNVRPCWS